MANQTVQQTRSAQAMEQAGRRLAGTLPPGAIVALHGMYGAGKTTFARGLARGLGVTSRWVQSPSFVLAHEFRAHRKGIQHFIHLDLWRLRAVHGEDRQTLTHYFRLPNAIVAVEWAEHIPRSLRKYITHIVDIRMVKGKSRKIITKKLPYANGEEQQQSITKQRLLQEGNL